MHVNQGAFTPTCSVNHVPGYIQNLPKLREKGVDIVAVVAFNDPFVMSAWGKANAVRDDIVSISPLCTFPGPVLILVDRFSSRIPMPSSPRALAGRMRRRAAQAGMRSLSITVRSAMPKSRPKRVLSRYGFYSSFPVLLANSSIRLQKSGADAILASL